MKTLNLLVTVADSGTASTDTASSVVGSSTLGIVTLLEGGSGRDERESSKSSEDSLGEHFCCWCYWCVYRSINSECWVCLVQTFCLSRLTLIGGGERVERFLMVGEQRGRRLKVFIPCVLSI